MLLRFSNVDLGHKTPEEKVREYKRILAEQIEAIIIENSFTKDITVRELLDWLRKH